MKREGEKLESQNFREKIEREKEILSGDKIKRGRMKIGGGTNSASMEQKRQKRKR